MTDQHSQHSRNDPPEGWIAAEGWPVLALAGMITIILTFIALPLGSFALGLMVWLRYILRLPARQIPDDDTAILAPADGKVLAVVSGAVEGPAGTGIEAGHRITIRTGLADAQLQRSPLGGRIVDNFLIPGLFRSSEDMALARRDNERREITIEAEDGTRVLLVQIGSNTARHLVCRFGPGKYLAAGAPLGMARIGGMTDLFLPADAAIMVAPGQTVFAGETMLARRRS
jgi:phosphatidylserine decarboxylase